ncbi:MULTISPECIES: DUF4177 domain-containing protein [unclassified Sagittula]|jgi:hypothetical protein|uniref:DUF4177 domain-containing protein n=1 Tax=unclassified Sagittula TaxID=2624628 RepID=UPI0024C3B22C|nr:DUF4177 domain-containing protein [Sagittula sp. MA-2]WHZ33608.1 DUF4177 domain-containing protein [Sagittula sp. MA-2]
MRYEYRIVPAPEKGEKLKGASAEARFAAAVERVLNDMAARGWEYQRTDTLPATERAGLTGAETVWRNLLVFRRPHAADASVFQPRLLEPPQTASVTAPAPQLWRVEDTHADPEAEPPAPPARPPRTPVGPHDAADVALRTALTGPMDGGSSPEGSA